MLYVNPPPDYLRRSSAVDYIVVEALPTGVEGYFRLSFGGRTTEDIPHSVSSTGLETVLERLHDYQLDVIVQKTVSGKTYFL
jgi:hypothetical protein